MELYFLILINGCAKLHIIMNRIEKKRIDREFAEFMKRNFEKPKKCKNLEQIRFYVRELSQKVEELKRRFNYVPDAAYLLLTQYNHLQNRWVYTEFKNRY